MAWVRVKNTHTHKLAQQVIFSESNSLTKKMTGLTTTHTTTDLGLWRPNTDQGKTPWRIKTLRMGEKISMRKKTKYIV